VVGVDGKDGVDGEVTMDGPLVRVASLDPEVGEATDGGDGEATDGPLARVANPRVASPRVASPRAAREGGEDTGRGLEDGMDGVTTALAGAVLPLESQARLVDLGLESQASLVDYLVIGLPMDGVDLVLESQARAADLVLESRARAAAAALEIRGLTLQTTHGLETHGPTATPG